MVTNLSFCPVHLLWAVDPAVLALMLPPRLPPLARDCVWSVASWLALTCLDACSLGSISPAGSVTYTFQLLPAPLVTVKQHEWCGILLSGDLDCLSHTVLGMPLSLKADIHFWNLTRA